MQTGPETMDYRPFIDRYRSGEVRTPIFHDLVLNDIKLRQKPVVLDIGCGKGFDDEPRYSTSLASHAGRYIGVEPDAAVELLPIFTEVYHSFFESAPIEPNTVDVAFCVMVLEHIESPAEFLKKTSEVLRPGGVFWGFTMDKRHWFTWASKFADVIHAKELYLNMIHGRRGIDRYENYPVHYRMNCPGDFQQLAGEFTAVDFLNFYRRGQLDFYYPKKLRWAGRALDSITHSLGMPGSVLAVRLQK